MRHHWPSFLLVALIILVCGGVLLANPWYDERDVIQERLDLATPPLSPDYTISQTFVSKHDGLNQIEILLVVYETGSDRPADGRITLTVERMDAEGGQRIVSQPIGSMTHNQRLAFAFEPIATSGDGEFRLTLAAQADYGIGCWRTNSEAYAGGELDLKGDPVSGDLYFVTSYRYQLVEMLADVLTAVAQGASWLPALLLLLGLPGFVLGLFLIPRNRFDFWTYGAWVIGLSLAFWPLTLLWASVFGLGLANGGIWVLVAGLLIAGIVGARRSHGASLIRRSCTSQDAVASIALLLVLALTALSRVVQVRDLVLPAWVDSVHHAVVTQLIAQLGQVPSNYAPLLQVNDFHYHFGFHTNAAALVWLTGHSTERSVLVMGQVLNMVPVLTSYALTVRLSGRRWAGVLCALVVGLLTSMPAYYVSWGRYTQLSGLCVLPMAALAAIDLFESSDRARPALLAAFLAAGLFLLHYRVIVFYALFVAVWTILLGMRGRLGRGVVIELATGLGLLIGGALLFAFPWLARLVLRILPQVQGIYEGWQSPESYNDFPVGLLSMGWTEPLSYGALGALGWALVRRRWQIVAIGAWVALWFLAANLSVVGLVDIWLIHNSSVVISLWLPTGIVLGWCAADLGQLGAKALNQRWPRGSWEIILSLLAAVSVVVLGGWGFWRMVDILNPLTIFAGEEDLRAMEWAKENTPTDAMFLINTRAWSGELRVGSDGGWWLPIVADRQTTLPCVLYHQGDKAYRDELIEFARLVEGIESVDSPDLIGVLREKGVTHVFVGAKGGRLMPKDLDPSPHYVMRYALGPTRIYEFVPDP